MRSFAESVDISLLRQSVTVAPSRPSRARGLKHLESVDLVAQLLWVAPQAAASALLLPQPGLVLHFGPFVPREISIGRMVARLVCVLFK